ncbi:MAG: DUF262 domain-containing protein [Akkermansiaceae bacterium]|nr:DUF262 domain-containing protein [Akkermansiaceae bacterium]
MRWRFLVPFYQRGYRWREPQVKQLLEDIHEATSKDANVFYCIQPIVVAHRDGDSWELIDGQQRLTTINLILAAYGETPLEIRYERYGVGGGPESFDLPFGMEPIPDWHTFVELHPAKNTVDYFHLHEAWKTIGAWKQQHGGREWVAAVLKRTNVIWYQVAGGHAISEFIRFNSGKISLTPCELLKALFLSVGGGPERGRSEEEISGEWDQMEAALHDEDFWHFLKPGELALQAPNRIAVVFELLRPSSKEDGRAGDAYFTKVSKHVDGACLIGDWLEVRHCFLTLQEWFADRDTRHLVGFLRWARGRETSLRSMWEAGKSATRGGFRDWLKGRMREIIHRGGRSASWKDAIYGPDSHYIQDLLLWFNIRNLPPGMSYPFSLHARVKGWSLEHIHARSSPEDANKEQQQEWINGCIKLLERTKAGASDMGEEIGRLISRFEKLASGYPAAGDLPEELKKEMNDLSSRIGEFIPSGIEEDLDRVWNLALLGRSENSSLSNNFFHQKREKILGFEGDPERFIPPATVRVFLKAWSDDPGDLMLWADNDRKGYKTSLEAVFENP